MAEYVPFRDATSNDLLRLTSARRRHIDDKQFRIMPRVQQAAGRRRIRKGFAQTDLTRRGLGGIP